MATSESSDSPQVKLIREWSQGFQKKDLGILATALHKDFRQVTYPRSLNQPDKTKEEWLGHIAGVISLWTDVEETIHSVIDAPGKVVAHWTNKAKTSIGVDMTYEAISIAHIVTDEDGNLKIKQFEQFVDSKTYLDAMQAFAAAGAKSFSMCT